MPATAGLSTPDALAQWPWSTIYGVLAMAEDHEKLPGYHVGTSDWGHRGWPLSSTPFARVYYIFSRFYFLFRCLFFFLFLFFSLLSSCPGVVLPLQKRRGEGKRAGRDIS